MLPLEQKTIEVSGVFTARYLLSKPKNPRELVVALHGYSQSADFFFKKLDGVFTDDQIVLAPHGPFPLPFPEGEGYRLGFSWYFYESATDEYYIDMAASLDYLEKLIRGLGLEALPKRILGYSQGGYLAPFAGLKLTNVNQVIGLNCQFLDDEIKEAISFPMESLNGANDEVVDPKKARESFEKLKKKGLKGEFHLIEATGHGISSEMKTVLKKILGQRPF